jgi:hypothetical protein
MISLMGVAGAENKLGSELQRTTWDFIGTTTRAQCISFGQEDPQACSSTKERNDFLSAFSSRATEA